jgi:Kef-type K+ transport system membrane component KefB
VLCRILTELKLLSTPVGIITLAAGVGDDVVGWVLLALCVALVNAGTGIAALYVILTAIAWALFLAFAVRPGFMWVLRRTHSLQDGPTQGVMVLTVLMVRPTFCYIQSISSVQLSEYMLILWLVPIVSWKLILHRRDWRASHFRSFSCWPHLPA